ARHEQRRTRLDQRHVRCQLVHCGDSLCVSVSFAVGSPNSCESFFCTSMIVSAHSSWACKRASSRLSWAFSTAKGSLLRPRFLGCKPFQAPSRISRRQFVRCDEYSPSRRSKAPRARGLRQVLASFRIRSLYSAEKVRRFAFRLTSGSGIG